MPPQTQSPPSLAPNIAFQISKHYKLDNTPFADSDTGYRPVPFIGRKELRDKFLEFLDGNEKKGVFLVTGYRGMGKTSFVNHVMKMYREPEPAEYFRNKQGVPEAVSERKKRREEKKQKKILKDRAEKIIPIHLTLAQSKPKEVDILRLMVNTVFDKYKHPSRSRIRTWKFWKWFKLYAVKTMLYSWKLCFLLLLFITAITIFIKYNECIECLNADWVFDNSTVKKLLEHAQATLIYLWFLYLLIFTILKLSIYRITSKGGASIRIERLISNCYAMVTEENASSDEMHIPYLKARMTDAEKRVKQYPIAEAKQIEYELQMFLKTVSDEEQLEFIFVFDELDKVDPAISTSYLNEDIESSENKKNANSYERDLRERKQAVINIIAGLKNFFTTANARFIFIAGREMFDASLADIADRQSSIGSIFTYVFNIESLLKEKELGLDANRNTNNADLTSLSLAIEEFLKYILFAEANKEDRDQLVKQSLYELAIERYLGIKISSEGGANQDVIDELQGDISRIYFTLQNLVTYLTYRSNGSPQKLIKLIHEFILRRTTQNFDNDKGRVISYRITPEQYLNEREECLFLYFGYHKQYRIGFINYLYRPFLMQHGREFKWFSDNIVVSTSYLFDHLLKFHPFAFSLMNLEMVPEVLSTNKTASLREHLKQIIDYLGANHIRETELSLFDYKFYSRTLHEISYLSRIFEHEAAALNFTLDESYLIKLHVRNKIKELRNVYYRATSQDEAAGQIFSIANLNAILGDLHFFDQEYDDAIIAYSDAIKPISRAAVDKMDMQNFMTLVKNKLKIGLCFEKTKSHEEALAVYADCCNDGETFIRSKLPDAYSTNADDYSQEENGTKKGYQNSLFYNAALGDVLEIVLQAFLAKLFIQEKIGLDGISSFKLTNGLGSFVNVTQAFPDPEKHNHLLKANAFMYTGKLLYFKNSPVGFDFSDIIKKDGSKKMDFYTYLRNLVAANVSGTVKKENNAKDCPEKQTRALHMYIMSLYEVLRSKYSEHESDFVKAVEHPGKENIITIMLADVAKRVHDKNFRSVHYRYIGSLLSNIGDCLLGTYVVKPLGRNTEGRYNAFRIEDIFKKSHLDCKDFEAKLEAHEFHYFLNDKKNRTFDLTDVLRCYYWSGKYFLKYGRKVSGGFQFNKIQHLLMVIFETVDTPEKDDRLRMNFLEMLKSKIVDPALLIAAENTASGDIHMVAKARKYKISDQYALNNISYHPESRETILLYNYIAFKTGDRDTDIEKLTKSFTTVGTQYARLMELDMYAKYLYVTNPFLYQKVDTSLKDDKKCEIIVNYMFTSLSMLRILEIYGANYSVGYRYNAYKHFQVANVLENCKDFIEGHKSIESDMHQYLRNFAYTTLMPLYHYKKAKELYEKAIQMHTGGVEYRATLNGMIYLEDDFNDNAYHFGAAVDRYLITNGVLKAKVEFCEKKIKKLGEEYSADKYTSPLSKPAR